ncbi:hypothetical protein RHGRI_002278 [Rhododendron griersonianum]|uniref:GCF C-terminal domain-containing protein n=1 Tax=Rhododendron griersonianum TaxID=479676 RepID=A0AAV6LND9_9ERIC|nr:hypothetical protein RHGRI_002278 [Rhododendron griersonianum]
MDRKQFWLRQSIKCDDCSLCTKRGTKVMARSKICKTRTRSKEVEFTCTRCRRQKITFLYETGSSSYISCRGGRLVSESKPGEYRIEETTLETQLKEEEKKRKKKEEEEKAEEEDDAAVAVFLQKQDDLRNLRVRKTIQSSLGFVKWDYGDESNDPDDDNGSQHEAPFIEKLEKQMQKLNEDRAAAILKRRSSDNNDEMHELEAAINAAMSVFNKGGGSDAMIEVATREAKAASAATKEQRNLPVELVEFGRDTNLQKWMDMTRRADVQRTTQARSDAKRLSSMGSDGPYQQIEGESSTDESDSETAAYKSNRDLLLQTAEQVFSDVVEEYSQLAVVEERFDNWKKDYPSSDRDAYMSLSVPATFTSYVRLELLQWDPLHEYMDFIDMNWYSLLYSYGNEDEKDISPDANLVSHLVEKVAVPILHHEIAHCWDMLSTRETRNAVLATELVVRYIPASSESLIELVAVLHDRLADAIGDLVVCIQSYYTNHINLCFLISISVELYLIGVVGMEYRMDIFGENTEMVLRFSISLLSFREKLLVPTWSPLVLKAVPNGARVAAYRFGRSVRLMRNICMWNKIIALPVLDRLVLDDLLSGKVLPHLRSIQSNVHDAVTRTERLIASLCGVWAGPSAVGQRSPKLQPLVDYLLTLDRTLQKKHVSGLSEGETSGLARRLKKMLVELNEYEQVC